MTQVYIYEALQHITLAFHWTWNDVIVIFNQTLSDPKDARVIRESHKYVTGLHRCWAMLCSVASVMSDSATLCTIACQAPLSKGFSRQEYWNGLPCSPSGNLPNTRMEHMFRYVSCIVGRIFTAEPLGNPIGVHMSSSKYPVGETAVFSLDPNWNYNDPDHTGERDYFLTYVKAGRKAAQQKIISYAWVSAATQEANENPITFLQRQWKAL